jgi:hypothetical protein
MTSLSNILNSESSEKRAVEESEDADYWTRISYVRIGDGLMVELLWGTNVVGRDFASFRWTARRLAKRMVRDAERGIVWA